ncbi:hypothetical protein RUM43_005238 [Polyplax serrata]|uniref:NADH dehydrogenase [ubiquinone] 1 alpha subcomplex subunit 5 n=1 Tax=Polyplax serrata TaxID=468196 RepID=A0AAN8SBS3_POLSC
MAAVIKQTTQLTGLAVSHNPKYTLNRYYKKILSILGRMPETASYRKHTEGIIKQRSYIINSTDNIKIMEDKIGCGVIEEVIIQAKNELALAELLLVKRPWERLMNPIPQNQWKWPAK